MHYKWIYTIFYIESYLVLRRHSVERGARGVMGLSLLEKRLFPAFIDEIQRLVYPRLRIDPLIAKLPLGIV